MPAVLLSLQSPMQLKKLNAEGLWAYALRILRGKGYSVSELRSRLVQRAEHPADVPALMEKLKEYKYLDDRRLADSLAAARLENQGLGKQRVLSDLSRRRLAPSLARRAVEKAYQGTDEEALIRAFLARKFRKIDLAEHLAEPRHLAAVYRRLRAAGFASASAVRVLKSYTQSAEMLEGWEEDAAQE